MKTNLLRLWLIAIMTLVASISYAYDVEQDGVYYNIYGTEASVTRGDSEYSGDVQIASTVMYNGNTYSVTSIGEKAFFCCSGLTSVTIPNSVTSIGEEAFRDCSGLTSVTIPNSVTSIGGYAFEYCSSLTSVTIPNSVTSIGNSAFGFCSGLTSFNVDLDNKYYSSQDNVLFDKAKTTLLCVPTKQGAYTIPNSVTSIGEKAFLGCSGLTSVTIPNSVTSIGWAAFSGCSGLTSVTIPNSVTSIGDEAFDGCSGLTSVSIPNSVTSIGSYAFDGCSGLTSVTIPNSVTSIKKCAFFGCSGLTSVTIGNSVTSIGWAAFSGCSGLTSVTIPNSVTSIGDEAFASCRFLETFICNAKRDPALGDDVFEDINLAFATLYVPDASVTGYSKTAPWSDFGNILPLSQVPQGIEEVRIDTVAPSAPIYNLQGQRQATTQHGLNIIDGKKRLMK